MKFSKILAVAVAVGAALLSPPTASAQLGFDAFAAMDTVILQPPAQVTVTNSSAALNGYSNAVPVDCFVLTGVAAIDLTWTTNAGFGAAMGNMKATILTSPDTTNWYSLSNYCLATPYSFTYTNASFGNASNLTASTLYNLPGQPTTPYPPSAGQATPYLAENSWTSTGAIVVTNNTTQTVGVRMVDQNRYFEVLWTPVNATGTNGTVSATIHAPYKVRY